MTFQLSLDQNKPSRIAGFFENDAVKAGMKLIAQWPIGTIIEVVGKSYKEGKW
jgi:hypothetical protein